MLRIDGWETLGQPIARPVALAAWQALNGHAGNRPSSFQPHPRRDRRLENSQSENNLMTRAPQTPVCNSIVAELQSQVAALFAQGLALHQQGQLPQAKLIYDKVLARQPQHFDALHLSGVIAVQSKNPTLAVELIGRAIEINPSNAAAYSNRGLALQELKRADEALASYDRAIAIKPDYSEAYSNRGVILQMLNRLEEALASYDRAIAFRPDYAEAYFNRGNALRELKRMEEALASYDRAIAIKPGYAEAYSNRGSALQALKRAKEALASYDKAIAIKPDNAEAYSNRGVALQELKCVEEALVSYDRAIAIKPDYAEAYSNRGNALRELKRLEEALASYDRAIAIKPDYAEAHYNRGNTLQDLKRVEEALASCDRAIAIKPDYAEAYYNRGNALQELKRLEEALASYDRAIAYKPDYAEAYLNKSLGLLLAGDLGRGWELYEWRWRYELAPRNFPQPLWLGEEDIVGKTILLHAEQGLGDTIQFCRYAKLVKALGAKVLLEAPKALLGLLSGLEGVDELIEQGKTLPAFDYHSPLLSLPLAFKTDLTKIPSPKPYLAASPEMCDKWAQCLGAKSKPRVGLAWSGNRANRNDRRRSIALETIMASLPMDGFDYISLQWEVRSEDEAARAALTGSGRLRHFGDELADFRNMAALAAAMDVVVCVDTGVAHMCGALGLRTFVLLSYIPDWRWLLDRDDSPWYESLKLYRQGEDRMWGAPLARIAQDLALLPDRADGVQARNLEK